MQYSKIPEAVLRSDVPASAKLVWVVIYDHGPASKWTTIARIQKRTGLSRRTVLRAISDLEIRGMLVVRRAPKKGRKPSVYTALIPGDQPALDDDWVRSLPPNNGAKREPLVAQKNGAKREPFDVSKWHHYPSLSPNIIPPKPPKGGFPPVAAQGTQQTQEPSRRRRPTKLEANLERLRRLADEEGARGGSSNQQEAGCKNGST